MKPYGRLVGEKIMTFEKGKWYKTSDGYDVEFIVPIEKDGMYNVFRHAEENDFRPYYTNEEGATASGERIICEASPITTSASNGPTTGLSTSSI